LHDNEKTEFSDEVFSRRYVKDYLKRVTGRLQTSENWGFVRSKGEFACQLKGGLVYGTVQKETYCGQTETRSRRNLCDEKNPRSGLQNRS
jgi:hypothetical protein